MKEDFFDMTVIKVLEEMKLPFGFKIVKKHIVQQKKVFKIHYVYSTMD